MSLPKMLGAILDYVFCFSEALCSIFTRTDVIDLFIPLHVLHWENVPHNIISIKPIM